MPSSVYWAVTLLVAVWGILCSEMSVVGWNAQTSVLLRQVNGIKIKVNCVLASLLRKLILTVEQIPSWRTSLWNLMETAMRLEDTNKGIWKYMKKWFRIWCLCDLIPHCFLLMEFFWFLCKLYCPHWGKQKADAVSFSGLLRKSKEMQSTRAEQRRRNFSHALNQKELCIWS